MTFVCHTRCIATMQQQFIVRSGTSPYCSPLMPVTHADATAAAELLKKSSRVLCICHRGPDGDAIGALLGVGLLIEQQFPNIPVSMHCVDDVPETFKFLPGASRVMGPPTMKPGDAVVVVDCAEPKMTEMHITHPQIFDKSTPLIMIDHHPGNPQFGTVNMLVPEAASSCEIIVAKADLLKWDIKNDIATCL